MKTIKLEHMELRQAIEFYLNEKIFKKPVKVYNVRESGNLDEYKKLIAECIVVLDYAEEPEAEVKADPSEEPTTEDPDTEAFVRELRQREEEQRKRCNKRRSI